MQNNCTLYSCHIAADCLIGYKSIILEGARIEEGSVIGPNSVVPPGRIIPSHQLWAGNPVEYIRDLNKGELQHIKHQAKTIVSLNFEHQYEFLPHGEAYLLKSNTENDLNPSLDELRDQAPYKDDDNDLG